MKDICRSELAEIQSDKYWNKKAKLRSEEPTSTNDDSLDKPLVENKENGPLPPSLVIPINKVHMIDIAFWLSSKNIF